MDGTSGHTMANVPDLDGPNFGPLRRPVASVAYKSRSAAGPNSRVCRPEECAQRVGGYGANTPVRSLGRLWLAPERKFDSRTESKRRPPSHS